MPRGRAAPPDRRTAKRRVALIDEREQTRRRQGSRAARQRSAPVQASSLDPHLPLELVQIDHTPVDVIVVDERHRKPLGRPWLTLAVDVATRVVLARDDLRSHEEGRGIELRLLDGRRVGG